jgi:predicted nucleic acid-binding protein
MKKVFIDSDIIVDVISDRHPFTEHSAAVLNLCFKNQLKAYTTPIIIANMYFVLSKIVDKTILKQNIKELLGFIDIIEVSKNSILRALNSDFSDFEDAVQNYSAVEHSEVEIIITRNVKDYKHSTLSVYDPETFLNTLS